MRSFARMHARALGTVTLCVCPGKVVCMSTRYELRKQEGYLEYKSSTCLVAHARAWIDRRVCSAMSVDPLEFD